jgi:chlorobactene glucosyltransferase
MNVLLVAFRRIWRLLPHFTTLTLLLLLSYRLASNLRFLRRAHRQSLQAPLLLPSVSVLVPARNETATITACVTSLLHQEYPNVEVIVLNDASTDDTGEQLDRLAAIYPQLKVIHAGDNLPIGWNGKSYACRRLAEHAKGEWLLFTDADTQHMPQSVTRGIAQAIALNADLLSAFPFQQTLTWAERIVVSFIVDFVPLLTLDLRAICAGEGIQSAANGQYLLVRASAYHSVGGHASIYHQTLDDFALAKQFRANGYRIALVDGKELLCCRMYHNAREVWNGFSRSLMLGLDNSTLERHSFGWMALFAWGYASLFVNPFHGLFFANQRWLALIEIFWLVMLRALANWHLKRPLYELFTTPLAAWGVMALGTAAIYRRWQGKTISWKGRFYTN